MALTTPVRCGPSGPGGSGDQANDQARTSSRWERPPGVVTRGREGGMDSGTTLDGTERGGPDELARTVNRNQQTGNGRPGR